MKVLRSKYPPAFKAKRALEAIEEEKTSSGLSSQYQLHSVQIGNWKATLKKGAKNLFSGNRKDRMLLTEILNPVEKWGRCFLR